MLEPESKNESTKLNQEDIVDINISDDDSDENSLVNDNPTTQSKQNWGWLGFSATASIPNAFNAMISISGWSAEKFGSNPSGWWQNMPTIKGLYSIATGLLSWHVNTDQSNYFVPRAFKKVSDDIKKCNKNPIKKTLALSLGTGAAIAQAIISYESCAWLGPIAGSGWANLFGGIFGTLNFVTYAASRTAGVESCFDLASNLFSRTGQLKRSVAKALNHLSYTDQEILTSQLALQHLPQNEDEVEELLENIRLGFRSNPNWHRSDNWQERGLIGFDVAVATLMLISSSGIFFQKSLDGVSLFAGKEKIENSGLFLQILIGSLGTVSSFLYFISALNIREKIITGLKNDSWPTIGFILETIIASASMLTVVNGVEANPDNFFKFSNQTNYGKLLPWLVAASSCITNLSSSLSLREIRQQKEKAANPPKISDIARWLVDKKHFTDSERSNLHLTNTLFSQPISKNNSTNNSPYPREERRPLLGNRSPR